MTDLKREVARFRDSESHSGKYISDLEARLARSDESVLSLQQTVERLEKEVDQRRDEVEVLQSRLETLRLDGEGWRTDLEERERRVRELEERMEDWERKRQDAGATRTRLGNVVNEVAQARRSLEVDLKSAPAMGVADADAEASPVHHNGMPLPEETDGSLTSTTPTPADPDAALQSQFFALQETHNATLTDLSTVTSKYRDALREISDLAAQIQEAKLNNPMAEPMVDSPTTTEKSIELPPGSPARRRMPSNGRLRESSEPQFNAAGRRLFFRQAASAESLHSR